MVDDTRDPPRAPQKKRVTAQDILDAAHEAIGDRAASRDVGKERSMARTVATFNALTGHKLTEAPGWQFMAVLKLARAQGARLNMDDYIDGAAYMALAGECAKQAAEPLTVAEADALARRIATTA